MRRFDLRRPVRHVIRRLAQLRHGPHTVAELGLVIIAVIPTPLPSDFRVALGFAAAAAWLVHGAVIEADHYTRRDDRELAKRVVARAARDLLQTPLVYGSEDPLGLHGPRRTTSLRLLADGDRAEPMHFKAFEETSRLAERLDSARDEFAGDAGPQMVNLDQRAQQLAIAVLSSLDASSAILHELAELRHDRDGLLSRGSDVPALALFEQAHLDPRHRALESRAKTCVSAASELGKTSQPVVARAAAASALPRQAALALAADAARRIVAESAPSTWMGRATGVAAGADLRAIYASGDFNFDPKERRDGWMYFGDSIRAVREELETVHRTVGGDLSDSDELLVARLLEWDRDLGRMATRTGELVTAVEDAAVKGLEPVQVRELEEQLLKARTSFRELIGQVLNAIDELVAIADAAGTMAAPPDKAVRA